LVVLGSVAGPRRIAAREAKTIRSAGERVSLEVGSVHSHVDLRAQRCRNGPDHVPTALERVRSVGEKIEVVGEPVVQVEADERCPGQ
jgi:hypothetical protein